MNQRQGSLTCQSEQRRNQIRAQAAWNGLDFLEVLTRDGGCELVVFFLKKWKDAPPLPADFGPANILIEGGQRVAGIKATKVSLCTETDDRRDDCMHIWLDRCGDFSTYTLFLVEVDENDQPVVEGEQDGQKRYRPLRGFDRRYASLDFSFTASCPSDLDCAAQEIYPPPQRQEPVTNYLAKDYASFRQLILDRLALVLPDWQERHVPDLGLTLVELLAYVADHLSYYQDAVATEAYLQTARQRISVRRHARLVDYVMHEGCNARALVFVEVSNDLELPADAFFVTGYNNALRFSQAILNQEDLHTVPAGQYEVFEPLPLGQGPARSLRQAHNEIPFYTWGDQVCWLPRGATSATLKDSYATEPASDAGHLRQLDLQEGDILIFEEVMSPKTGHPADANPGHRHAVRLTKVEQAVDELYDQPVVEINWAEADALPFPLCLSAIGPPPPCRLIEAVTVARGNIVLVDHGRWTTDTPWVETRWIVPPQGVTQVCKGRGDAAFVETTPARFRPVLQRGPLTFSQPLRADSPAAELLGQEPRQAVPCLTLTSIPPAPLASSDLAAVVPLFRPDDLADPINLARKLRQPAPEDVIAACLSRLLSAETRQRLAEYDGSDPLPAPLQQALQADLERLRQPWQAQQDLLSSQGHDRHFVVELDNRGRAQLRFGDGELGCQPEAGMAFQATYRVGNGPAGNVGAEAISHLVCGQTRLNGGINQVRNPLPAQGGLAAETLAEVKRFAPYAFRTELQRAVSPDDYASLVMRRFKRQVQGAKATLCWTGSWYEVLVAIDPLDRVEADQELLQEIETYLQQYRRIGHDVVVKPACYVPLDIKLVVYVRPHYLAGHVKADLLDRLSNRQLPGGRLGFFHPDNLTFGQGIRLSSLVALAQAVPGVENVVVERFQRCQELANQELEQGLLPLGPFEIARLDNNPNFPENGRLELEIG